MTEETKLKALGKKIKALRKSKGLSQEKFALKMGLHRTYIGAIERGERNVSFLNLQRIANALGITLSELFEGLN